MCPSCGRGPCPLCFIFFFFFFFADDITPVELFSGSGTTARSLKYAFMTSTSYGAVWGMLIGGFMSMTRSHVQWIRRGKTMMICVGLVECFTHLWPQVERFHMHLFGLGC